jgi:hypothetical protein
MQSFVAVKDAPKARAGSSTKTQEYQVQPIPSECSLIWAAEARSTPGIYSGCVRQPPSLLHASQYNSHAMMR